MAVMLVQSKPPPDFRARCIARAEPPGGATCWAKPRRIAQADFFQPAAFIQFHADGLPRPAGIFCRKGIANAACGKPVLAAQRIIIGYLERLPQDARHTEIGLRALCHTRPMLGPLPCHQPGRWHHAQMLAHVCRGQRRARFAPLRPALPAFGPQAMDDEAKAAGIACALQGMGTLALAWLAELRAQECNP